VDLAVLVKHFLDSPAPVIAPAIPAPVRPAWTSAVGPTGTFGGGGGGAVYYYPGYTGGAGGAGGGGNGGGPAPGPGFPAVDYTGGGGGGSDYANPAGDGGDGLVLIRYPL